MSLILCIETGTDICSVGIARDGELMSLRESDQGRDHAKQVAVFVDELLRETGVKPDELDAVAVGMGPGSYTGLRIGVSFAKGLCYGLNIPLLAVGSLEALTDVAIKDYEAGIIQVEGWDEALLCPMVDARRMEVYTQIFNSRCEAQSEVSAEIITEESFADILENNKVYFFGNGAEKCSKIITHKNAHFLTEHRSPLAKWMMPLAERAWAEKRFEDIAYFEPFYLKNFIATKPKELLKNIE
jgi:tRNA threonylcarbamoyladenosine biosynthesis protein TsaB